MKHAEQVTFGGSGLNRAAHLRGDDAALAQAYNHPDARCVVIWRGKPLMCGDQRDSLALMPMDHAVMDAGAPGRKGMVFLGLSDDGDAPRFACDISSWRPDGLDGSTLGMFVDPSEQYHPSLPSDHIFGELRRLMSRLSPRDAELAATAKAILGWHTTHGFCAA